jgi:hypothetical protein
MFRAVPCSSSGGQIVLLQHLVYAVLFEQHSRHHFINIRWLTFFQSDDTRCSNNTILPPEDAHGTARTMSRIIM